MMIIRKRIRGELIKFFTPPNRIKPSGQDYFDENIGIVVDKLLALLNDNNIVVVVGRELPLMSRKRAESAVPETDCSGRKYTPIEREDNVRYVLDGAEIQRDKDKYDSGWKAVVPLIEVTGDKAQ